MSSVVTSIARVFAAWPGEEGWLREELSRVYPRGEHQAVGPGWVCSRLTEADAQRVAAVAFTREVLDRAVEVEAESISSWARTLGPALVAALEARGGPWRLQIWCLEDPRGPVTMARCRRIEAALLEWLQLKRRHLLRLRVEGPGAGSGEAPVPDPATLVQVVLRTPTRGWWSMTGPEERRVLRRVLSRGVGGHILVPELPQAPSSAYRKLLEAEVELGQGIGPGERCVDLGASPGGWSIVALERGAQVWAVDRCPLREDLMANPRLEFVRADAFRFVPGAPVDWLLCDVIAFPPRSLELLLSWLDRALCRRFIVTIKFRGHEDYPILETFKAALEARGVEYKLKRLRHNRNEVTAMGEVRGGA